MDGFNQRPEDSYQIGGVHIPGERFVLGPLCGSKVPMRIGHEAMMGRHVQPEVAPASKVGPRAVDEKYRFAC